jgi:hypothetical protein
MQLLELQTLVEVEVVVDSLSPEVLTPMDLLINLEEGVVAEF